MLVNYGFRHVLDPFVLKSIGSSNPIFWIKGQQFGNQVNGIRRNVFPLFFVRPKFAFFYFLYYLIIIGTVERRITAEQNIQNNPNTP